MALFGVSGLVHAYWMGRVGRTALAAVTIGTTLRIALISPMMGLSAGGMAVVARHVGARDQRRADHAVMQTILLIFAFILPLCILGQLMGNTFLGWMGAEGALREEALAYLRIIFGGLVFMEMLPTLNGVIRGAGHPEYTLRINIVNVVMMLLLEPILVLGLGPLPAMGVRGAAWATVLSSASGVGAQLLTLRRGSAGLRIHLRNARPDRAVIKSVLKIALPTSAQRFSPNLAAALLMRLVTSFGNEVLTAYSVVMCLFGFLQCLPRGIGSATATIVGQNLGARRPARAERGTMLAVRGAIAASLVLFGALTICPAGLLGLFDRTEAVLAIGMVATRYGLLWGTGMGWSTVVGMALGGAGDAVSPMLVNMGALWLVQLPLCWALSRGLGWGPQGIWAGMAVSFAVSAVAMALRFKGGRWKEIVV